MDSDRHSEQDATGPVTHAPRHVDDFGPTGEHARWSSRPALQANSSVITSGFTGLVVLTMLAWLLGAGPTTLCLIVILLSVAVSAFVHLTVRHHHQDILSYVSHLEDDSARWEKRWRELHADSLLATTAISQLTDGVVVLSSEGRVLLVNPAAKKLLFLSRDDNHLGWLFVEVVRDPKIKALINSAREHQIACSETVELSGGQTVRPTRIDVNPITSGGDRALLLIIHDETETRRVDEIRREFVANVSHELKTPLAAIKGYAETVELAIQDDPESACHFMQQILSQCQRLERLVADMMQLARAQGGTHNMTLVQVKLCDVIAEALRACEPVAESKQIELTCREIHPDSIVIADREATLTIANNLISNAIRYTPEGGHVEIGTERIKDYWAMVVCDDGVGIPEAEQQRIFERFYRVAKTRETTGGGTGIGLSIVKNLTLAQSGEIQLSSRPGQGSTFRVLLPAINVNNETRQTASPARPAENAKSGSGSDT
tara:strand:- start:133241 stop:134710 length:1470 start_codon:yes stop_codon:yes gene_type:complete